MLSLLDRKPHAMHAAFCPTGRALNRKPHASHAAFSLGQNNCVTGEIIVFAGSALTIPQYLRGGSNHSQPPDRRPSRRGPVPPATLTKSHSPEIACAAPYRGPIRS